jgi:hypothetical protein
LIFNESKNFLEYVSDNPSRLLSKLVVSVQPRKAGGPSFSLTLLTNPHRGSAPPDAATAIVHRGVSFIRGVPEPSFCEGWEADQIFLAFCLP